MTHPIVQEFLKGKNDAGGTIRELELELESETRWADHYFRKWQSAQQSVQRTACAEWLALSILFNIVLLAVVLVSIAAR